MTKLGLSTKNETFLSKLTFYLKDDDNEVVDFNGDFLIFKRNKNENLKTLKSDFTSIMKFILNYHCERTWKNCYPQKFKKPTNGRHRRTKKQTLIFY